MSGRAGMFVTWRRRALRTARGARAAVLGMSWRRRALATGVVVASLATVTVVTDSDDPAGGDRSGSSSAFGRQFERQFARPGADVRPMADWFLPEDLAAMSPEAMEREIADVADAGLGGVTLFNVEMALTAGENDLLTSTLEAAREHGITVDLTLGAAFPPVGVPTNTPGSGTEQQELVYGTTTIAGGATFAGPVPPPPSPNAARRATLEAVVAARCRATCGGEPPALLDEGSMVDLTGAVTEEREISWTAPGATGEWLLFGFWRRPTETPYADYFSPDGTAAVTDYWDEHVFTPEVQGLLDEVGGQVFEDSLHLEGFQLWTPDFLAEFERRRGYSLREYLPVTVIPYLNDFFVNTFEVAQSITPASPADFDVAGDHGSRIRNDYHQTLSELYEEHHLRPLNDWARSHGLAYRAKPSYGASFDISAGAAVDVANTESFAHANQLDGYRSLAGAVHLGGRNRLAVECCPTVTQVGHDLYSTTWQQTLSVLHGSYAGGANQVSLNGLGYPDEPGARWPGSWPFTSEIVPPLGLAEPFGPRMPYWEHMPDVTALMGREQLVLRQGEPRVDVAVYRHSYWSHGFPILANHPPMGLWFDDKRMERAGYTYDFVGPALFDLPNATVEQGRLDAGGPAYKALVLAAPEHVHSVRGMPLAAALKVVEYAQAGLPVIVVGEMPDRTGSFGDAADDGEVQDALAQLLATPGVHQVATEAEVPGVLAELGIRPDAAPARSSNVVSAHRASDAADFYFLYNQNGVDTITGEPSPARPAPFDQEVSFAGVGQPYALDAWTGEITPIATYQTTSGRTTLRVRLAPGESTIIGISRHGRQGDRDPGHDELHATSTTADEVVFGGEGSLRVRATRPGTYATTLSNGRTVRSTIGGLPEATTLSSWQLSVDDWRPGAQPDETTIVEHELDLASLAPWPEIRELRDVSGVGRYSAELRLGREWTRRGRGVRLELGSLFDSVRVRVNGHALPVVDRYNGVVDVTRYVERGTNTIEVEVATTLRNRLRTLSTWPEFATVGRQPYGLTGPVRLVPYGEAEIRSGRG